MENRIFERTELLLGSKTQVALAEVKVILFGVGGVGSWCAESLIRSGVRFLTLVDMDCVDVTNINRQLMATTETIGQVKVEVLKDRLLAINPKAAISVLHKRYTPESSVDFNLSSYDYVIDAIDSIVDKADLLERTCNRTEAVIFSSMGAALKVDVNRIQTAEFWNVTGCPLAASLRRRFRKSNIKLNRAINCVFSDEKYTPKNDIKSHLVEGNQRINGTLAHITAIFGFTLAGMLIEDVINKSA